MPRPKTDRLTEDKILDLRAKGKSYSQISKITGVSKAGICGILKRRQDARCAPEHVIQEKRIEELARAEGRKTYELREEQGVQRVVPILDDSSPIHVEDFEQPIDGPAGAVRPATGEERRFLEELTRERTAREMMTLLAVAKRGYAEARHSKQEPDKKTWQEIQYLKLYRDAIKLMVEATGLDRDTVMDLPASPVDEYLSKTLELIKDADGNVRVNRTHRDNDESRPGTCEEGAGIRGRYGLPERVGGRRAFVQDGHRARRLRALHPS